MTRLKWDSNKYSSGVSHVAFYDTTGAHVWNGVISVEEDTDTTDQTFTYQDGIKSQARTRLGGIEGSLTTYFVPDEILRSKVVAMTYKETTTGVLHILYNVSFSESYSLTYSANGEEAITVKFTTRKAKIGSGGYSAHMIVDPSIAYPSALADVEDLLYGTSSEDARIPSIDEVVQIFEDNSILKVTDHGDGIFTIDGPDTAITMVNATTFEVNWPSVVIINTNEYEISSL